MIFFFKAKAIIEYLDRLYVEEMKSKKSKKSVNTNASLIAQKKQKKAAESCLEFDQINILHFNHSPKNNILVSDDSIQEIRPFIVCCICRDLDLETPGLFKKFLSIQVILNFRKIQNIFDQIKQI